MLKNNDNMFAQGNGIIQFLTIVACKIGYPCDMGTLIHLIKQEMSYCSLFLTGRILLKRYLNRSIYFSVEIHQIHRGKVKTYILHQIDKPGVYNPAYKCFRL